MDEETVQRLMEAAIRATQSTNTQHVQSLRKPDLPPFDKKNVDIWIKRVESAYARVNCVNPALKFAHLEAKFEVNADPIIDGYLFGDATDATWTAFLGYLRTRYGPTTKDRALSVINGTPREGRTPSQLVAVMKEKAGTVSLDDILKEQLLKQLPNDVLKQIVDRVDKLTCDETAKLADSWFDKDGKTLLASNATSINSVDENAPTLPPTASAAAPTTFTPAFETDDSDADINAIRFRQGQKQAFNIQNREAGRGRGRGRGSQGGSGRNSSNPGANSNSNSYGNSSSYSGTGGNAKKQVCRFHVKFGDKAENCTEWCILNPQRKAPKGKPTS